MESSLILLSVILVCAGVFAVSTLAASGIHFMTHLKSRHVSVVASWWLLLAASLQVMNLAYATVVESRTIQNNAIALGVCVVGLVPWTLGHLIWLHTLTPLSKFRVFIGLQIVLTTVFTAAYVLAEVNGNDTLFDLWVGLFIAVTVVPTGSIIMSRNLRNYTNHGAIRDSFLPIAVLLSVGGGAFHHLDTPMRIGVVCFSACVLPLLVLRVHLPFLWKSQDLMRHPWDYLFLTMDDVDQIHRGVAMFLATVADFVPEMQSSEVGHDLELWVVNERWMASKMRGVEKQRYMRERDTVGTLLLGGDVNMTRQTLCPEAVRVRLLSKFTRHYQRWLGNVKFRSQFRKTQLRSMQRTLTEETNNLFINSEEESMTGPVESHITLEEDRAAMARLHLQAQDDHDEDDDGNQALELVPTARKATHSSASSDSFDTDTRGDVLDSSTHQKETDSDDSEFEDITYASLHDFKSTPVDNEDDDVTYAAFSDFKSPQ